MSDFRRLLLLGLGFVMLIGGTSMSAYGDTLMDIQKRGKVIVGTNFSSQPWGFYDDQRRPAGLDIDMAKELAAAMNVELEFVDTLIPNRIANLEAKKVDVIFASFVITPERALRIAFSRPYGGLVSVMFSKKGDGIESPKDLAGKRVAVTKGASSGAKMRAAAPPSAQIMEFESPTDMLLAVRQGKADAGTEQFNVVDAFIKQNPTFTVKGQPLPPVDLVGIGVRQEDYSLLYWLNTWLLTLENTGKIDELYQKWFGIKRPPLPH